MGISPTLKHGIWGVIAILSIYPAFLCLLTIPSVQKQAIYLNAIQMTWGKNLLEPEQWGFLRNQVTPFWISTPDGERLLAWHILPLALYLEHEEVLKTTSHNATDDITRTTGFKLLKENKKSKLVLYFHGAAGTLGSGFRPASYHAISAASAKDVHIIAIDYRGYGMSTGKPSETGLISDATTLVNFALEKAEVSPSRVVLFGQSLGTAVSIAIAERFAKQTPPIFFSGMVLVAPFANAKALMATYRLAGTIPLVDPLARFPRMLALLQSFLTDTWSSDKRLQSFLRKAHGLIDGQYRISIIHGKDDYDIPHSHSETLFIQALNETAEEDETYDQVNNLAETSREDMNAAGYAMSRNTNRGWLSLNILEYGLHDKIMGYPIVSRAVRRAFD